MILVFSFFLYCLTSNATSIHVGSGFAFQTIQAALTSAQDGDSIIVHGGEFHERNIIIDKRIFFIGLDFPILDGDSEFEVISIKRDSVVMSGFEIRNSGRSSIRDLAGIKIYDSNYVTISGNRLRNTFFGIYTQFGKHCKIIGNDLEGPGGEEQQCGNGIHCWKCDSMQIISNVARKHRDGIYFEFVTNSVIWRNESFQNIRYGLHFMFSNHDLYVTNYFHGNGAGVAVMFSNHVNMYNNYFEDNWGDSAYGILLKEISDGQVEGNTFSSNTSGIFMEGASRIRMRKNKFLNNGWGLKIQASCMDIELSSCDFKGNSFDVATNGSLVLNSFDGNYWDKYEGYDLNRDMLGDIEYRPVSMYSYVVEHNPSAMLLFRSLITAVMDKSEKIVPSLTPVELKDSTPLMESVLI
jgi:nitrous oxidase accessory protein